jgi:predicted Fe-S protein YdhL (DUF1289 family)
VRFFSAAVCHAAVRLMSLDGSHAEEFCRLCARSREESATEWTKYEQSIAKAVRLPGTVMQKNVCR